MLAKYLEVVFNLNSRPFNFRARVKLVLRLTHDQLCAFPVGVATANFCVLQVNF